MSRSVKYRFALIFGASAILFPFIFGFVNQEPSVHVNLLAINDLHGQIDQETTFNKDKAGTAAYLAAYLRRQKANNPTNTLMVNSGDSVGASPPASALLQDEPTIEVLNNLGFDIATLGNHEFDDGTEEMMRLIKGGNHPETGDFKGANFPYISANVVDKTTKKPILAPYYIKKLNGISIGFIGVTTTEAPTAIVPDKVKNIEFLDEVQSINKYTRELKQKGVNAIMVLAHAGGFQNPSNGVITGEIADIAKKLDPEVDVIFAGHTHSFLNGTVNKKLIVQSYNYGAALTDVDLEINSVTGKVSSKKATTIKTLHKGIKPDSDMQKLVTDLTKKVRPIIDEKISSTKDDMYKSVNSSGESVLGNFVTDAYRNAMGVDFGFVNQHGIRADLPKGTITWGDLYRVQPFGNLMVTMNLTGDQIRRVLNQQYQNLDRIRRLHVSGLRFTFDLKRPLNDKVISITKLDKTPIVSSEIYKVVINDFLAAGGGEFSIFKEGTDRFTGPKDFDLFLPYVRKLVQLISAEIDGRVLEINSK